MTRLRGTAILLLASHFALIACQPYRPSTSSIESEIYDVPSSSTDENLNHPSARDDIDRVIIIARDTPTTSESTTLTTTASTSSETSTSTTYSDTSTTSTSSTSASTSTSTSTSSTSTITTSTSSTTSTSTQSTTTSTSTTSSRSTTTATSSSTTTTTASATSTTSAEIAEWNRKGNIAATIFSCCLISLFSGVSILHCARDRAKSKRLAARELMSAKPTEPLVASRGGSTAELIPDRSSILFKDNPFGEQRPQTAYSAVRSNNGWGRVSPAEQNATTERSMPVNGSSNGDRQHETLV
ncbi:hypothetical protein PENSUB_5787 [Penicillium subrubescens]|uniref:Uncharacterized protein n=1 Tax=Penicillium subrubescens TaxID=1316194 RepID=A0A1Q5U5B8_9EURO|nr:hypothetical protein PENSUB_5787 [Penicillium subrubescens]